MSQKDDSVGGDLNVPRGVEVLIKKAAVDPEFKNTLLAERSAAAARIGLILEPVEATMLSAAPVEQLEAIIAGTVVPQEHRRAFLGQAAAAMLATFGAVATGCGNEVKGIRPDKATKGIRPDMPEKTTGSRPDLPEPKSESNEERKS
jgi:hypothetical protein